MYNNGYNQYANNPPPPQDRGWGNYPGQATHQQNNNGWGAPPPQNNGGWGAPPPPQNGGGWGAPPPPQNNGGWGAPPPQQQQWGGGHDTRASYNQPQGGYGSYAPPTGAPPVAHYAPTAAGYQPPSGAGMSYAPPGGPPPMRPPSGSQHYGPQMQSSHGKQQPYFQYSQCTGKRKALLIGINYFRQQGELRGCINDVHNVQKFLMERYKYRAEDMVILTDDARNPRQMPTKQNMIAAMQWLVRGAAPNDALFFHYSGHGGQTKDTSGDEDDGNDEVIYPVDFKQAGHILDDDSCRLTAIFDSCHSATALDLPYVYSTEGKIKEPNLLAEAGSGVMSAASSYMRGDVMGMATGLFKTGKQLMGGNSNAVNVTRQTRTSPADVVMFSGCKDSQTSADTSEAGKATGAMSYAFIAALTKYPQMSYIQLLRQLRQELAGKYSQKPQMSSSHPIDTNILFIC